MKTEPNEREQEQTPEEILAILIEAKETGREILIEQRQSDGSVIENPAVPLEIDEEGGYIYVDAGEYGLNVLIETIKKVKIIEEEVKDTYNKNIITENID